MSADNFLVTIPAKDGQVALYDVSMSDPDIRTDVPELHHQVCAHIAKHYASSLLGTFANRQAADVAAEAYMEDNVVEYGSVDLSISPGRIYPCD